MGSYIYHNSIAVDKILNLNRLFVFIQGEIFDPPTGVVSEEESVLKFRREISSRVKDATSRRTSAKLWTCNWRTCCSYVNYGSGLAVKDPRSRWTGSMVPVNHWSLVNKRWNC